MFDKIHCSPFSTSQTTKAIADGADVRYSIMFIAADDGSACAFSCAVYHAGNSEAVAHSLDAYGDKITTF